MTRTAHDRRRRFSWWAHTKALRVVAVAAVSYIALSLPHCARAGGEDPTTAIDNSSFGEVHEAAAGILLLARDHHRQLDLVNNNHDSDKATAGRPAVPVAAAAAAATVARSAPRRPERAGPLRGRGTSFPVRARTPAAAATATARVRASSDDLRRPRGTGGARGDDARGRVPLWQRSNRTRPTVGRGGDGGGGEASSGARLRAQHLAEFRASRGGRNGTLPARATITRNGERGGPDPRARGARGGSGRSGGRGGRGGAQDSRGGRGRSAGRGALPGIAAAGEGVEVEDMTPFLSKRDFANAVAALTDSTWLTRLRGGDGGSYGAAGAGGALAQEVTGGEGGGSPSTAKAAPAAGTSLPGSTCRQFNWTETTAVQALLHRHQNPPDCAAAKFLVYHPRRSGGLAALLVQLKNALTLGLMTGRVITFFDAQGWPLVDARDCGNRTFDCLLHSLSRCELSAGEQLETRSGGGNRAAYLNVGTLDDRATQARRVVHADIGANAFSKHVPRAFADKDQFWWLAQALAFLFRPRPHVLHELREFAAAHRWGPRQVTTALHLRSADRGKNYIGPLLEYVRRDPVLSAVDRVFVATDDTEAVDTLQQVATQDAVAAASDVGGRGGAAGLFADVIFERGEDRRQHVVEDILRARQRGAAPGQRPRAAVNATRLTLEAVKNVALLASGQYFVGTQDSGFSEAAAALGCAVGRVRAEPLVFAHWRKDQDPADPPVGNMGTTYYQGPGLLVGERPPGNGNLFDAQDQTLHGLPAVDARVLRMLRLEPLRRQR